MSAAKDITDQEFEEQVLKSELPVLVDFWAEWCGPCKALSPTVDEIANQFADKLKVVKIDVASNPATPRSYGVVSIPTLILFKNGEAAERILGFRSKADIESAISKHI
mgnify:CR=1 FL=1